MKVGHFDHHQLFLGWWQPRVGGEGASSMKVDGGCQGWL